MFSSHPDLCIQRFLCWDPSPPLSDSSLFYFLFGSLKNPAGILNLIWKRSVNLPTPCCTPALLFLLPWVSSSHRAFMACGCFLLSSLFLVEMHPSKIRTKFLLPSGWQQWKHKAWTRLPDLSTRSGSCPWTLSGTSFSIFFIASVWGGPTLCYCPVIWGDYLWTS